MAFGVEAQPDDEFETIWVEIINTKVKKIFCAAVPTDTLPSTLSGLKNILSQLYLR